MNKLLFVVTVIAEIALTIANRSMYEAWKITGDAFYYIMGEVMCILLLAFAVPWIIIFRNDRRNKARE